MKKLLRILLLLIIIWAGYFFLTNNPLTPAINNETPTTGLVFINDAWFTKQPIGGIEAMRDAPDGLDSIEKCRTTPADFGGIEVCNDMQKRLDEYVLADYYFEYSGFYVLVLDTSTVSWHEEIMMSGMTELIQIWTYPMNLVKNILTDSIRMNRAVNNGVVDMPDQQFPNADMTRTFISFEGQDGLSPVIHIVFKKWEYLVRITNMDRAYPFGGPNPETPSLLSPSLTTLMKWFYDTEMALAEKDPNHELTPEKLIEAYTSDIASNTEYATLLNKTLADALRRFAIK